MLQIFAESFLNATRLRDWSPGESRPAATWRERDRAAERHWMRTAGFY